MVNWQTFSQTVTCREVIVPQLAPGVMDDAAESTVNYRVQSNILDTTAFLT